MYTAAAVLLYLVLWKLEVPCWMKAIFGLPCPGCGMTRAWLALFRGDVGRAFGMNPMFWSIPILYGYILADGHLLGHKWADRMVLGLLLGGLAVLFLARALVPAWRV